MILCVSFSYSIVFLRQDLQDLLDFVIHHFPDESDEMQSAFGGGAVCLECFLMVCPKFMSRMDEVFAFFPERRKKIISCLSYKSCPEDFVGDVFVFHCIIDRIKRISWIFFFLSSRVKLRKSDPPAAERYYAIVSWGLHGGQG